MSTDKTSTALATQPVASTALQSLDSFYEEQGLALLNSADGGFTRAINLAEAYTRLRGMLTEEVMRPIMGLQGSPLGFKTDKIYSADVVKDALIEATIKGFYPVQNEINILAGRQYTTKEGFHGWFRRAADKGRCSFPQWKLSVPRTTTDGAVVVGSIACMWGEKKIELNNEEIPVKVNQGMGADAILGKAERKLFSRLYARCTGQVANDGDLSDGAIDIDSKPAPNSPPQPHAALSPELLADLEKALKPHEAKANDYLVSLGSIQKGQTFRDVNEPMARKVLKQLAGFLKAAGVEAHG